MKKLCCPAGYNVYDPFSRLLFTGLSGHLSINIVYLHTSTGKRRFRMHCTALCVDLRCVANASESRLVPAGSFTQRFRP